MTGCKGNDSQSLSDIPEAMVQTHGDSIALAARFTGDFNHFLAVTDSLADAGELSQIRADGLRGVAYFQLGQIDKCIECLRSAIADETPPAADFWEYIHAGTNLVIILNSQRNYDSAMRITLRLINLLKQVDNPLTARELQTLYLCLGDTKMMLEQREEAVESYNEAYQWVQRTPNDSTCRPLAICIETLENIAATHINHQMDAGIWVDRMDSLLAVYETQPKAIDKEVKTFRALVLLHRAQVCQMQGKEAEAARYYEQIFCHIHRDVADFLYIYSQILKLKQEDYEKVINGCRINAGGMDSVCTEYGISDQGDYARVIGKNLQGTGRTGQRTCGCQDEHG
jgi:tetratricopeptide (TPR) repeat protein